LNSPEADKTLIGAETGGGDGAIRLQVHLARGGAASRRGAEALITAGRVTVNGETVTALGSKVRPGDEVRLDGALVTQETRFLYILLNKPAGYICSSADPQGRPLALSLLPPVEERLYNVGRLDYRSSGLVIFTNDGNFARQVSHPGSEIEKEYLVESSVPIRDRVIEEFAKGVIIEGMLYRPRELERLGDKALRVVLVEGRNREIRRVFAFYHLHVVTIRRVRIGPVLMGTLGEGESRPLTEEELELLLPGGTGGNRVKKQRNGGER